MVLLGEGYPLPSQLARFLGGGLESRVEWEDIESEGGSAAYDVVMDIDDSGQHTWRGKSMAEIRPREMRGPESGVWIRMVEVPLVSLSLLGALKCIVFANQAEL